MSGAKKLAPPGRRGSAQAKRFEGDELAEGIEGGLRRGTAGAAEGEGGEGDTEADAARIQEERAAAAAAAAAEATRVQEERAAAAAAAEAMRVQEERAAAAAEAAEVELRGQEQAKAAQAEAAENQRKLQQEQQEQEQQQRQQERARQLQLQQQEQEQQRLQEEKRERDRQIQLDQQAEQNRMEQLQQEQHREREQAQQREMEEKIAAARAEREAKRQHELEEEARAEAHDKEQERLASQQRATETALAAAAITASESAALVEARRKAEETARKRAMFLSDVDDFSTTFGDKTREAEEQRRMLEEREGKVLTQGVSELGSAFVPPPAAAKSSPAAALEPAPAAIFTPPVVPTLEEQQRQRQEEEERQRALQAAQVPRDDGSSKATFSELSSSLFATKSGAGNDAVYQEMDAGPASGAEAEVLRMPSRIGQSGKPIGTPQLSSAAAYPDADEEEEEGMGADESISNVLTMEERRALSPQERVAWRALQVDLTTRRREFHGAVTYAFDGIFSWQMYGSAEAVDETGAAYTEYLMRCQWGTSWENMQPWISARRYREFDALDADLKRAFPSMEHSMPRLPAKDFFRFLEQDVIEKRRGTLENYMTRIVAHLPTILRSGLFSEFLGIGERISTIKPMLGLGAPSVGPTRGAGAGGEQLRARGGSSSSGSSSSSSGSVGSSGATDGAAGGPAAGLMGEGKVDLDASGLILTVDQAEAEKAAKGSVFFIDSELSLLEEQIRDLTLLLRSARPQELLFRNQRAYYLLVAITSEWPRLRATADMGAQHVDMDFTLIPRAMQIEEDLVRCIGDFRSLVAAHKFIE